ncbi:MAG: prepilin-type N-terminal cleavage/methylation domain-containing protein [Magnetococcus sp. DMHC-1]
MKISAQGQVVSRTQAGFTMIELIMVIVILGILAAVAVPKFTNLSSDARAAAVKGVAGGISSGNSNNVAICGVGNAACATVTNCSNGSLLLQGGALPSGYSITAAAISPATSGTTKTDCVLSDTTDTTITANFTVTYTP